MDFFKCMTCSALPSHYSIRDFPCRFSCNIHLPNDPLDDWKETWPYNTIKNGFDENQSFLASSLNKDIVICIGKKGAGKSTLVNFLANKELITNDSGDLVLQKIDDPTAMVIDSGGLSTISLPKSMEIENFTIFDIESIL